jgi:hypothetical protein
VRHLAWIHGGSETLLGMTTLTAERLQSQQTSERTGGSRPSAAEGGGAPAPALSTADHRSTSTQLLPGDRLFCHRHA